MPDATPDPLLEIADDLYALPLADFTPARDALAKEHKADKALAASIKGLRKASLAAWVVNLLVRRAGVKWVRDWGVKFLDVCLFAGAALVIGEAPLQPPL